MMHCDACICLHTRMYTCTWTCIRACVQVCIISINIFARFVHPGSSQGDAGFLP